MKKYGEKNLRVLTFVSHFIPGVKAGGAIRSVLNLVEALGDDLEFMIVTSDRDLNDKNTYFGILPDRWTQVGKAKVMYLSPRGKSILNLWKLLRYTEYDILYLNSFFDRFFSMVPIFIQLLGATSKVPIILAPRGEFSEGALNIKFIRKIIYIRVVNALNIYRKIEWHASSLHEKEDIIRIFKKNFYIKKGMHIKKVYGIDFLEKRDIEPHINIAIDLPGNEIIKEKPIFRQKETGKLRVVFLSRICRKKNLDLALELLKGLKGVVEFNIYGPVEDHIYWGKCKSLINNLSDNIIVRYCGEVPHEKVRFVFQEHDLFFFPTHGENYGHVIIEAITAGCPVLISDQTPWRNLEYKGVGWDFGLEEKDNFRSILQRCIDMGNEEYKMLSNRSYIYGHDRVTDPDILEQNRRLFLQDRFKMVEL